MAEEDLWCETCGNPATCFGCYEGVHGYACDTCCGHENEDGWCKMLEAGDDEGKNIQRKRKVSEMDEEKKSKWVLVEDTIAVKRWRLQCGQYILLAENNQGSCSLEIKGPNDRLLFAEDSVKSAMWRGENLMAFFVSDSPPPAPDIDIESHCVAHGLRVIDQADFTSAISDLEDIQSITRGLWLVLFENTVLAQVFDKIRMLAGDAKYKLEKRHSDE